ncbi:hypothetical protein ACQP3L_39175, partial [Escherichia coli]
EVSCDSSENIGKSRDTDVPKIMSKSHLSFVLNIKPPSDAKMLVEGFCHWISGLSNCQQNVIYSGFLVQGLPV